MSRQQCDDRYDEGYTDVMLDVLEMMENLEDE